jgi:hypothetical protein
MEIEVVSGDVAERKPGTAAVLTCRLAGSPYSVFISEAATKIQERCEFPEEEIVDTCEINEKDQFIRTTTRTPYTDMEVYTAMNKALMQRLFPEVPGKWLLARAQVEQYSESTAYQELTIALKRNLDFRLTKSEVFLDGNRAGSIYFSLLSEGRGP